MVCMEYYPFHKDENGNVSPVFRMLFRIEIPRSEFTYVNAMNKIIELNDEYRFDWIGIDRGYGEYTFVFLIYSFIIHLFAVIGQNPLKTYDD